MDVQEYDGEAQDDLRKKEIYTYTAPWLVYGMNWSVRPDQKFRLAIGSFLEDYTNKVQIVQLNEETGEFTPRGEFQHPYPTTKIMWVPDSTGTLSDLVGTTGDYMRIWQVAPEGDVQLKCLLNNTKNSEFCAPLTSFDWNVTDPNIIGTSSIDTTCTIWDIEVFSLSLSLSHSHSLSCFRFLFAFVFWLTILLTKLCRNKRHSHN
ncbi:DDB1- and CUL4-associated factor 7 [Balamuthia mandrillaris]